MDSELVAKQTTKRPIVKKRPGELSDAEKLQLGAPYIGSVFSSLNSELNEIWEDYVAIRFYLKEVHKQVKAGTIDRVIIPRLVSTPRMLPLGADAIYGILGRVREATSGRHAFIDAISAFEQFVSTLVFRVYLDFPGKLKGFSKQFEPETAARQQKLMEVIFESKDRHEIIHKLVEEKVRGIFYGSPIDLFAKDKAGVGFGDHFKNKRTKLLEEFQEMTARRNIIIHNERRIDRKYLVEVPSTSLRLGQKVGIEEDYLKRAILVMKDLAADAAQLVATNIYKEPLYGRAKKIQTAATKRPLK